MTALNEPDDPDSRLHAAWLRQASATAEVSLAKQESEQRIFDAGSAEHTRRLETASFLERCGLALPRLSRGASRSGVNYNRLDCSRVCDRRRYCRDATTSLGLRELATAEANRPAVTRHF